MYHREVEKFHVARILRMKATTGLKVSAGGKNRIEVFLIRRIISIVTSVISEVSLLSSTYNMTLKPTFSEFLPA